MVSGGGWAYKMDYNLGIMNHLLGLISHPNSAYIPSYVNQNAISVVGDDTLPDAKAIENVVVAPYNAGSRQGLPVEI